MHDGIKKNNKQFKLKNSIKHRSTTVITWWNKHSKIKLKRYYIFILNQLTHW